MRTVSKVLGFMTAAAMLASGPIASAEADIANGEKLFKRCIACHAVGEKARNKVGPVLNDVVGRTAGTYEKARYSKLMQAAGENGLVWTQENLAGYLQNPTPYLKEFLTEAGAADAAKGNGTMMFKIPKAEDAADLAAYLATQTTAQ